DTLSPRSSPRGAPGDQSSACLRTICAGPSRSRKPLRPASPARLDLPRFVRRPQVLEPRNAVGESARTIPRQPQGTVAVDELVEALCERVSRRLGHGLEGAVAGETGAGIVGEQLQHVD